MVFKPKLWKIIFLLNLKRNLASFWETDLCPSCCVASWEKHFCCKSQQIQAQPINMVVHSRQHFQMHFYQKNVYILNKIFDLRIEAWTKWSPFHRQHFEMHEPERKVLQTVLRFVHTVQLTTRTIRTPAFWGYPPPPHDYPHYWTMLGPNSKQGRMTLKIWVKVKGHHMRHTFSC